MQVCNFCAFLSTIHKGTTITSVYSLFRDTMTKFQKRVLQIIWNQKYLINHCLFLEAKTSYALVNPASTAVTWSSSWMEHIHFRPRLIAYPSWRKRSYLITSTTRKYNILFFFQALIGFRPWPAGVTSFLYMVISVFAHDHRVRYLVWSTIRNLLMSIMQ